jgi:hypothetical protein
MATADQIADFRLLIAESDEETYTDEQLSALLDASTSANAAASQIWIEKAASAASLVNVSESGSSRSLGDIQRNALAMAKVFGDNAAGDQSTSPGIRIRRITRS